MRFSITAFVSVLSLSLISGVAALPTQYSSASLESRDASAPNHVHESSFLDKRAKIKIAEDLGRGRKWLVGAKVDPTDGHKKTDQELGHELAELALIHFGQTRGTITEVFHLSNGESVEHIQIQPETGAKIHAYRDRRYTQGPGGKGDKKKKGGKRNVKAVVAEFE